MMNPPGNRDIGHTNKNQPTLSTESILFVREFNNSESVDLFVESVYRELSKRSSIKLFVVSNNQKFSQDRISFELQINIVMYNLNINSSDYIDRLINTINPAINKASDQYCQPDRSEHNLPRPNMPTAVNQRQAESVQSYPRNQNNHSWIRKIERTIKDPSSITLFPFLAFLAIVVAVVATVVIGGGKPSKDPSENTPLQNPSENRDPNLPSSSPSITPSPSPSTPNNRSRQNTR